MLLSIRTNFRFVSMRGSDHVGPSHVGGTISIRRDKVDLKQHRTREISPTVDISQRRSTRPQVHRVSDCVVLKLFDESPSLRFVSAIEMSHLITLATYVIPFSLSSPCLSL